VKLGTDRRIGGFRGYSANLDPMPWEHEPLLHALETLLERSGAPLRRPMSFGARYQTSTETPRQALRARVDAIPRELHLPLAKYVLNLIQAREWIDRGLRDVPREMRVAVFEALKTLPGETTDGTGYDAVVDDVAKRLDEHSLYYGCLKALQATQDARRELEGLYSLLDDGPGFRFVLETPWGSVHFSGEHSHAQTVSTVSRSFVYVDFTGAGHDIGGPLGATDVDTTLSAALLLDLGRKLKVGEKHGPDTRLASGVLGCGIVYTAGEGTTEYAAGDWSLGAGLFGLGALIDEGGDDRYELDQVGQGAAYFGIGLLLDAGGNDEYILREGDGQGMGGPGGIGILADRKGDDTYYAEADASKAGRADYHSDGEVAANNAQGVGSGRRGDGSDGHSWAGGLGALLDVEGDDHYTAGNFSQGLGYWYGTGLLWDGGGNDHYGSVYFTQGSGAHFAIGALIDEGGDDSHVLSVNAGAAFGFGWDVVNAFLIDRGTGNDRYEAKIISTGLAEVRSNAFFLDEGGDDTYVLNSGTPGMGDVDERADYLVPGRTSDFTYRIAQVGVFLDLAGTDVYLRRDPKSGLATPDEEARDGARWNVRVRDPDAQHAPNVSFGGDFEGATLRFLAPWPRRED